MRPREPGVASQEIEACSSMKMTSAELKADTKGRGPAGPGTTVESQEPRGTPAGGPARARTPPFPRDARGATTGTAGGAAADEGCGGGANACGDIEGGAAEIGAAVWPADRERMRSITAEWEHIGWCNKDAAELALCAAEGGRPPGGRC